MCSGYDQLGQICHRMARSAMSNTGDLSRTRGTALVVIAAVLLAGCTAHSGGAPQAAGTQGNPTPQTSTSSSSTTTGSSTTPSTPSTTPSSTATTKPVGTAKLRAGDKGTAVLQLQKQLSGLGYWLGTPDGHFGDLTQQAVYALQKAAGLQRDGVVGAKTRRALDAGRRPTITTTGTSHRIEINKKTQLLLIIDGSVITTILNTSTGSGLTFVEKGNTEVAVTPSGSFHIDRAIDGNRIGPLGALWRPRYFNGGIAIHGIASVPPYPASHGCARLSFGAINWIWSTNQAPIGTSVKVV
jgi:peptidoglycan hydrolase-like protein with peptidoglycan-binding domain